MSGREKERWGIKSVNSKTIANGSWVANENVRLKEEKLGYEYKLTEFNSG